MHHAQTPVRTARTVVDADADVAGPDTVTAVIASLGYAARLQQL